MFPLVPIAISAGAKIAGAFLGGAVVGSICSSGVKTVNVTETTKKSKKDKKKDKKKKKVSKAIKDATSHKEDSKKQPPVDRDMMMHVVIGKKKDK